MSPHLGGVKLLHIADERIQVCPHIRLNGTALREKVNQPNDVTFCCPLWTQIRRNIPETKRSIFTAADERCPINGKGERVYPTAMSAERGELRATLDIPKVDYLTTGTCQRLPILGKSDIPNRSDSCVERAPMLPPGNVP